MITNPKLLLGAAFVIAITGSIIITGSLVNWYKETRFTQRMAAFQQELARLKADATVKQAEADAARDAGKVKDEEIRQLRESNAVLAQEAEEKRVVYVRSRAPVGVRPFDGNISDADIRAAAKRAGLIIRHSP